jgi:hypothetical protein
MRCSLGSRKSELTLINVKAIVYANISTLLCFGVSDLSADWQKAQINPNSRQLVLGGKNYFAAIAIADQSVLGGKNYFAAIAIADQSVLGGKNYFAAIAIADQSVLGGAKTTSLRSRSQTNQFWGEKLLRCDRDRRPISSGG